MGRVKDWLMTMESLAEEALEAQLSEDEAIQFMADNLDYSDRALTDVRIGAFLQSPAATFRDVYRDVQQRII
tara:strand:- start:2484 stop:2699 length:216 start_codon:yes stop_codon:yes gene_type:complete